MNLSAAIMLVNESVRSVRVDYDPDNYKNTNPNKLFKTFDPDIRKDDFVIVPTHTRHGFTIAKVTEVDFVVDFNSADQWAWIAGKLDKAAYDHILAQETIVIARIGKAEENKMRNELRTSMGLGEIKFSDLDVVNGNAAIPVPSTPRGGNIASGGKVSAVKDNASDA